MHTHDWSPVPDASFGRAFASLADVLVAGADVEIRFLYVPPAAGVPAGANLRINLPPGFRPPQDRTPTQGAYVEIRCDAAAHFAARTFLTFHVAFPDGLSAGQTCEIVYNPAGPRRWEAATRVAYRDPVECSVDVRFAPGPYARLLSRRIAIRSREPHRLFLRVPTVAREGEPFDLRVSVRDELDNVVADFRGEVRLDGDRTRLSFPDRVLFTAEDQGNALLPKVCRFLGTRRSPTPEERLERAQEGHEVLPPPDELGDIQRISAQCGRLRGVSNPVALSGPDEPAVLWGDLHVHTRDLSDGMGTIDDAFHWMKEVSGFDFGGLGDHTFNGSHPFLVEIPADDVHISAEEWTRLVTKCRDLSDERFIGVPAYEWSGRVVNPGVPKQWSSPVMSDKNIVFGNYRTDNPVVYELVKNVEDPGLEAAKATTPDLLYRKLEGSEFLAISHSTTSQFMGTDFRYVDPRWEPVVEIYSMHGANEYYGNPRPLHSVYREGFVQQALAEGRRFGFAGGGDDHYTHPGSRAVDALDYLDVAYLRYRPGITGVLSDSFSLPGVFGALQRRACYATTGEYMLLRFAVDGRQAMGQELDVTGAPTFTCTVAGTDRIEKVELIRDNEVIHCFTGTHDKEKFAYRDDAMPPGEHFYYARVTQRDGETAWGSPVWIKRS